MELQKINEKARIIAFQIAEVAGMLWQKGWGESTSGNISVNVTGAFPGINMDFRTFPMISLDIPYPALAHNYIFITARNARMRTLAREPSRSICLIKISKAGDSYQVLFEDHDYPLEPSSEILTHLAIHDHMVRAGKGNTSIVHAHVHELVVLTHDPALQDGARLSAALMAMHTEIPFFLPEGMGYVPLVAPGSAELAKASLEALRDHSVVIWEKHGCMAIGRDVQEAFDRLDILAKAADIYLRSKLSGLRI